MELLALLLSAQLALRQQSPRHELNLLPRGDGDVACLKRIFPPSSSLVIVLPQPLGGEVLAAFHLCVTLFSKAPRFTLALMHQTCID